MKLKVTVNGITYDVDVDVEEEPAPTLGALMVRSTSAYGVTPTAAKTPGTAHSGLTAPLSGTVVRVPVAEGDPVSVGDTVLVLEAMKMETEITAPADGVVGEVLVDVGEAVQGGQVLVTWAD